MTDWQCDGCGRVLSHAPLKGQRCGCKMNGTPRPIMLEVLFLGELAGASSFLFQCPVCKTVKTGGHHDPLCTEDHELKEES